MEPGQSEKAMAGEAASVVGNESQQSHCGENAGNLALKQQKD